MEIKNKLIIIIKSKIDNFDKRNFIRYIKTFNVIFLIKMSMILKLNQRFTECPHVNILNLHLLMSLITGGGGTESKFSIYL